MPASMRGKWRQKKLVVAEPMTDKLRVYLQILKLAEIVYQKHYSFLKKHKQDLISVAVNKAVKMLEKGDFDPTKGNMRNYLYAGMRNDMQNYYVKYIKFTRKEIATEDFSLVQAGKPLHDSCYDIDFNRVYKPLKKFERRYGDLRLFALSYIYNVGWFIVDNVPDPSTLPETKIPEKLLPKLQTALLWSIFDSIIE